MSYFLIFLNIFAFIRYKCFTDFECALSNCNIKHFLQNPIQLDCFLGHCICKECIPEEGNNIKCSICGKLTKSNLKECDVSNEKQRQLEENYKPLFSETKERFKLCYDKIKGKITRYTVPGME